VNLAASNPDKGVTLHFFTTSEIGAERAGADRPGGIAGLAYWRMAAAGADINPLRVILDSDHYPEHVRAFVKGRGDDTLRTELLRNIHWDCGKPDFATLQLELVERLVVICRDRFSIPAPEVGRVADALVYHALQRSTLKTPGKRILTRAGLYRVIDSATRISAPRAALDVLYRLSATLTEMTGTDGASAAWSAGAPGWILESRHLPDPRPAIARTDVESKVAKALADYGACILSGSSGLGKSHIARVVASARAASFVIIDLRDIDVAETRRRLDMLFGRIGGLTWPTVILEDLNCLESPGVAVALGRLLEALRRRDGVAIITCYRRAAIRTLSEASLDEGCVLDCPYFSETEVHDLIILNGGDPERWGRLAFVTGVQGHPQLTHAFVQGIARRGWPAAELREVIDRGLASTDIDAARDAARRALTLALPESARNLLYRLSLMRGRFSRRLALRLGEGPPPIASTGESMDVLVGPWVETIGNDAYRVSPLAGGCGREILGADQQRTIHETIALEMLAQGQIDLADADVLIVHALAGESIWALAALAQSVLTAASETLPQLAANMIAFRLFPFDRPIVSNNRFVATMLRLAQFKLLAAAGENTDAAAAATALFGESQSQADSEPQRLLESMVLTTVLVTIGVGGYLDNWIKLIVRLQALAESDSLLADMATNAERGQGSDKGSFYGMLFGIGSMGIASVERLEKIIDELDMLKPEARALLLKPVDSRFSDYAIFINGPWAVEQRRVPLNAHNSAQSYGRMAKKTASWGMRAIALQCCVARAVIYDEYADDRAAALETLDEAVAEFGDDPILTRARAKLYWRRDDHAEALTLLRGIADQLGRNSPVERAFAMREAAISAGNTGEWILAETWFREARTAAARAEANDMQSMAIGLGADAAVAALEAGEVRAALSAMAEALTALAGLDPEHSLRSAYCHRVIRHAVLWMLSTIAKSNVTVDGKPPGMRAGTCSNPDPPPSIGEMALAPLNLAWYMLAESEIASGADTGIEAGLRKHLVGPPIAFMEIDLRMRWMTTTIPAGDHQKFAAHLWAYLEGVIYYLSEKESGGIKFDPLLPARGGVPPLGQDTLASAPLQEAAVDAILMFAMHAALAGDFDSIARLERSLSDQFGGAVPGVSVFQHWQGQLTALGLLERTIADMISSLRTGTHAEPSAFWLIGLRFFEKLNKSPFQRLLTPALARWQRTGWARIVEHETFRLHRPRRTVPPITRVLAMPANDQMFLAALLVEASDAVGAPLDSTYIQALKAMARGYDHAAPPMANNWVGEF
jgi:hypothetical protein